MLDIKFIRNNPDIVKIGCQKKNINIDIDKILELDKEYRGLLTQVEEKQALLNKFSKAIGEEKDYASKTAATIQEAKKLKGEIKELEEKIEKIKPELEKLLLLIPNLPLGSVPEGKDENDNVVLREVGEKTKFDFEIKDYFVLAEEKDWIDTKRAAKVAGSRFGYIKGEAALLEFALIRYALDILIKEEFIFVLPPVMINRKSMGAMGYLERGEDEIYHLEKDDLYLIGTSEQSIGPMHMDEIFEENELPRRYVGFSPCFRREAGSYGKDTKGILRVHQFNKLEMFSFCRPEDSLKEHQLLLSLEEKLMQALEIPYRVLNICAGDLGDPAAAKYDVEAWFPSQGKYRETHSTSNCADFQARRLNIRYLKLNPHFEKGGQGGISFVHTLNGTAFSERLLLTIIENYQKKDGSVETPLILKKYLPC